MNIIITLLSIYAFFSLIGSLISLLGRRKFLKSFSTDERFNNDLYLLEMSLFIDYPGKIKNSNLIEKNAEEIKKVLSIIKKIKENKILEIEELTYIEDTRHRLKLRLGDLIRLDSAYIFVNLVILLMIFYIF